MLIDRENHTMKLSADGPTINIAKTLEFPEAKNFSTIRSATGVPKLFDPHPDIASLVVKDINFTMKSPLVWELSISYEPRSGEMPTMPETGYRPWDYPPEIDAQPVPDIMEVDDTCYLEGDLRYMPLGMIQLPTGKPFDDPPMKPVGAKRITAKWNAQTVNNDHFQEAEYTTNAAAVTVGGLVYSIGTLYMENCFWNEAYDTDGTKYYKCQAQMLYNPRGHHFKPLFADWEAVFDGKVLPIWKIKATGEWGPPPESPAEGDAAVTEKVPLASDGTLLATSPTDLIGATPVYGDFQRIFAHGWELDLPARRGRYRTR